MLSLLIGTVLIGAVLGAGDGGYKITKNYVDYYPGDPDSNVVLTSPHDGHIKDVAIPPRLRGCYDAPTKQCDWHHGCQGQRVDRKCSVITWADRLSSVLALEMRDAIAAVTGRVPHLIVSRLHRSLLDPNRDRENAAQYDPTAGLTYDTFHGWIQEVHDKISARGRPGIHFDIHGYTSHNTDNWMELGYNLHGRDLNSGDLDPETSSIRALAARSDKPFASIIAGDDSLGKLVMEQGYRTVPSPQYPRPNTGVQGKYFRGGYITRQWGSLYGGDIDCVQFEVPQWIRDESEVNGKKMGQAFGQWVTYHYPEPYHEE